METLSGQTLQSASRARHNRSTGPSHQRTGPQLCAVAMPAIRLDLPQEPVPDAWQNSLAQLTEWLGLNLSPAARTATTRFGQLAEWATPGSGADRAAIFAPWQITSPITLQTAVSVSKPPINWLASYLFDYGAGKLPRGGPLDLMLMTPHPAACASAQAGDAPLPRPHLLHTMIAAAKTEGRRKLAIIVDTGSRNAITSQLLLADRALTRDGIAIEILSVEDGLAALMRQLDRWDALIVMPQWRSVIFAVLAEGSGMTQPWPLLWHRGGLQLVTSEAISSQAGKQTLHAPLLVLGLIAALRHQGQLRPAQQLYDAAAQLWDRGVATPGRPSQAPYAHHLNDEEFLHQITKAAPAAHYRPTQPWALLTGQAPKESARPTTGLRLVVPD